MSHLASDHPFNQTRSIFRSPLYFVHYSNSKIKFPLKDRLCSLIFRCHLNKRPFSYQIAFQRYITKLVCYSDLHYIVQFILFLHTGGNVKMLKAKKICEKPKIFSELRTRFYVEKIFFFKKFVRFFAFTYLPGEALGTVGN